MWAFLLFDISYTYAQYNPLFQAGAHQPRSHVSLASQGVLLKATTIIMIGMKGYAGLLLSYSLIAAVAVALGHSEPRVWPNIIGEWKDAYTIRRFWG